MILLLGAMNEEISALLDHADDARKKEWNKFCEYSGTIEGKKVIIAKTGVGKSMSAMYTQHLIDSYHPDYILFSGLAGAINPKLDIGDILIAEDCIQYDLDATEFGFKTGEVPFTDYRFFCSDKKLISFAKDYNDPDLNICTGRILTGDKFISGKNRKLYNDIFSELEGDAVEMEGASVALTAAVNKVPFLLIRAVSDKADGNAPSNFNDFLDKASHHLLDITIHIIKQL